MSKEKEGWSSSVIGYRRHSHYYKNGISLCGRMETDNGHKYFDKSKRTKGDSYSYHCKICIDKQPIIKTP